MRCPLALLALLAAFPAGAATTAFGVRLPRDGLVVEVPYSTGTHHEHVTGVEGTVRLDPETLRLDGGRLVIPLAGFRSDDAKRGCHLREALGLDYARSRFPREHVCDDQNKLPASGPDAIAFPEIIVELTRGGPKGSATPGATTAVEVEGSLTAHGVTRPVELHLTAAHDASSPATLHVRGRVPLRLTDFGIQVKPAKVLFISITVRDEITLAVDTLLEPTARR